MSLNVVAFWLLKFGIFAVVVFSIGTKRTVMLGVAVAVLVLATFYQVGATAVVLSFGTGARIEMHRAPRERSHP